jgi:gastrin-releasing peptide receptor
MVRMNGSAAATDEVAVLDTVADLYRTSIQQVESVKELVEHLTEMMSEEDKIVATRRNAQQQMEAISAFNKSSVLQITVGKRKELVNLLQNLSERAGNMSEHTDGTPFIDVITSGMISRFLDAQYWAKLLERQTQVLVNYQTLLHEEQHGQFVGDVVVPIIGAIVLVVGMTGNGLLLTIFIRHKETRTLANSMLINLTVVDFLSLVVNVLLDYLLGGQPWPLGWFGCKLFIFFYYLLIAVSIYSVAIISVQRFVAVWQLHSLAWCHQSQQTKYVLIATVWGLGCILSVPHGVMYNIDSENEDCYTVAFEYRVPVHTGNLILFCVMPLLITAVFSGLTAHRIRRSVREIPGEATRLQQLRHSRMVSSTVLFALTVLFVISNVPFFLFQFLIFVEDMYEYMSSWTFALLNVVTYSLRFLNCCLNPIVLLVLTKRYRGYIKRYCGRGRYSQQ